MMNVIKESNKRIAELEASVTKLKKFKAAESDDDGMF